MAALTAARPVKTLGDTFPQREFAVPIADNVKIYCGAIAACVTASGLATPAVTATTITALGIVLPLNQYSQVYDNTLVGHAASLFQVRVGRGTFAMNNSTAGDLIAQAQFMTQVFIVDDQTVAKTNGGATRSGAGICTQVDADGTVWVQIGPSTTPF